MAPPQTPPLEPVLDPPPPSGTGASAIQDKIADVGGRLLDLYRLHGYPGFAGVVANAEAASLLLYWTTGEPLPPEVAAIVASPGYPITVTRVNADYGRSYLESRVELLKADPGVHNRICGLIHTIIVVEEGYGLRVGIDPYREVDEAAYRSAASATLTALIGVPVYVDLENAPEVTVGRQSDDPPWWGGARLTTRFERCSSGFGVIRLRGDPPNLPYLLSAAHCFPAGRQVFNGAPAPPAARQVGTVRDFLPGFDSELIEVVNTTTVSPTIYTGEWDGPGSTAVNAEPGANIKGIGMFVCFSGASTGRNCFQKVTNTNVTILNPAFSDILRLQFQWTSKIVTTEVIALRGIFLGIAVGTGDSGGPVVRFDSAGRTVALGTIVAGSRETRCSRAAPNTRCFARGYYADINNLLEVYGVRLAP